MDAAREPATRTTGRLRSTSFRMLKPGSNHLAVEAVNTTDNPCPAGLIAARTLQYKDGRKETITTDKAWQSAQTVKENWNTSAAAGEGFVAAMELGLSAWPRGETWAAGLRRRTVSRGGPGDRRAQENGHPAGFHLPDREARRSRYATFTARRTESDIYFVANKFPQHEEAVCSFRVQGKRPEFWWPDTGKSSVPRFTTWTTARSACRFPSTP